MSAPPGSPDFAAVRQREYRWGPERIFLNAASYGPLPECGRAAVEDFDRRRQRAELTDADFLDSVTKARASAARLLGAADAEIALVPNTSVGINLAAHIAAERAAGRRAIVLSDREFPANVYPWLALARRGVEIRMVSTQSNGQPDEDALADALAAPDVAAFAISFVQ
ncbi:MAG TPA: aminotransferase class V-fold PLP-dependent enzyme, partial [Longimicrobiales bacterium]|nr:aminotransferase class V-fold PLP-dependent enzyme [Longimicrobiales bacterium]